MFVKLMKASNCAEFYNHIKTLWFEGNLTMLIQVEKVTNWILKKTGLIIEQSKSLSRWGNVAIVKANVYDFPCVSNCRKIILVLQQIWERHIKRYKTCFLQVRLRRIMDRNWLFL